MQIPKFLLLHLKNLGFKIREYYNSYPIFEALYTVERDNALTLAIVQGLARDLTEYVVPEYRTTITRQVGFEHPDYHFIVELKRERVWTRAKIKVCMN